MRFSLLAITEMNLFLHRRYSLCKIYSLLALISLHAVLEVASKFYTVKYYHMLLEFSRAFSIN